MSSIVIDIPIEKEPNRVFEACTESKQLATWFAEHAEISLDENRYDFWGRHTPGFPDRNNGQHRLLKFDDSRYLSFEWRLRGVNTTVEFEITPKAKGSVFHLKHTGLPALQPYESSLGDFWTHVLEGLREWLENDRPYKLMDFSRVPYGDVSLTVNIGARPHDVFVALTDPIQLNRWIASKAKTDLRRGGEYSFGWEAGPVRILDLIADKKLSYSWNWEKEPDTVTTWELEGSEGGTRVTVVQSGFEGDRRSEDYYIGWFKFIYRLKTMLEGGPDWKRADVSSADA